MLSPGAVYCAVRFRCAACRFPEDAATAVFAMSTSSHSQHDETMQALANLDRLATVGRDFRPPADVRMAERRC